MTGGIDKTVKVWDSDSGELIYTLKGHTNNVRCVTSSLTGQFYALGSSNEAIKIWSTSNGELIKTLGGHKGDVCSVYFSPDGNWLVSTYFSGLAVIWAMDSGELIKKIPGINSRVTKTAKFSFCGGYLATALDEKFISIWSVGSWNRVKTLDGDEIIAAFDYSLDLIAGACGDGRKNITLWSVETGMIKNVMKGHSNVINTIVFSPCGNFIVSGSIDKSIRIWSLNECIQVFDSLPSSIWSVRLSKSSNQIASIDMDGRITIWG